MSTTELRSQLHTIIDQVTDKNILQAIHTLLSCQVTHYGFTAEGHDLTKKEFDHLLAVSEEEIQLGKIISTADLKKEIKTWRKK